MSVLLFLAVAVGVAVAFGALVIWGTNGPPTRPRPRSRYRGPTFMDVDRKLQRTRRR